MINKDSVIAVWFSCGAASAVAAKKTVDKYGERCKVRIVNNPVVEEHPDNLRFLKDVEQWIGIPIELATNPKYKSGSCEEVWHARKYMAGPTGAPCTVELKKKARQRWESQNHVDYHVLGFTYDEQKRHERFIMTERDNVLPVLIDEKITKKECFKILIKAGIELPAMYKLGYPNANCIGCVKASSSTYWNHVRKTHPEVFEKRSAMSRQLGAKLVWYKGKRIFLDELDPNAKGHKMKSIDFDCSSFCEEKFEV